MLSVCHGQFAGVLADSTLAKMADFPPPEKVSFYAILFKENSKAEKKHDCKAFFDTGTFS